MFGVNKGANSSGVFCLTNRSTTPLDSGDNYTGEWVDVEGFPSVTFACKTDTDCTLYIQFTNDTHTLSPPSSIPYSVTANTNKVDGVTVTRKYCRLYLLNDSDDNQTTLDLSLILGWQGLLRSPLNQIIQKDSDATVVRTTSYSDEVASGLRQGKTTWHKFGYNLDVDTAAEEIIASFGGAFNPLTNVMLTAQTFTITYNNATDGAGQTGARTLLVYYLDSNYLLQIAVHTLGSTGTDVTSFSGFGINRVIVYTNGGASYNTNAITFTATSDGTTQAQVPATASVTQQMLFHTQIGYNFLMKQVIIDCLKLAGGSAPKVTIYCYSFSRVTLGRYEVLRKSLDTSLSNLIDIIYAEPLKFGGREVIYFTCVTNTNDTIVSGRFVGIEEAVLN